MERLLSYPELRTMINPEGKLLMFSPTRFDKQKTMQELHIITDLIDDRKLPVGNSVLSSPAESTAVTALIPQSLDQIQITCVYKGRPDSETAYAASFAEGASFCNDLLKEKPHLLFTLTGLFNYDIHHIALTNHLPLGAGIKQDNLVGEYPHQQLIYRAWLERENEVKDEPLRYNAFMQGISRTLDTVASRFREQVPISNPYLTRIGITDPRIKPSPQQKTAIQQYFDVARRVAYVAGLIETSRNGGTNHGINRAHDVVEMVKEGVFRHTQSRQRHFLAGLMHDDLFKIWWDEKNPYDAYEAWFLDNDDRIPAASFFPALKPFEAASLEAMLREDASLMFSDVPLHPDADWYDANPKLKEMEERKRQEILQAHTDLYWEKNVLWMMFRDPDSLLLGHLDRIKEEYHQQLDGGSEFTRDLNLLIPEDLDLRVAYALDETKYGWNEYRFLSEDNRRLFVAKYILSSIEFRKFIQSWQQEIRNRIAFERDFILTKFFIEEQIRTMGWEDLYDKDGRSDLTRFESTLPFWIGPFSAVPKERSMMLWEKIRRLFVHYQLLAPDDLEVVELICQMAGS